MVTADVTPTSFPEKKMILAVHIPFGNVPPVKLRLQTSVAV